MIIIKRLSIIGKFAIINIGLALAIGLVTAILFATSIPEAISIVGVGIVSYLAGGIIGFIAMYAISLFGTSPKQTKESKRFSRELIEFDELLSLILAERNYVEKAIADLNSFCARYNASSDPCKKQKFFPYKIKSLKEYSKELSELDEILDQLILLGNDYPDFDKKKFFQLGYIEKKSIEFSNHHALVMFLAAEFCKRAHGLQQQPVTRSKLKESFMAAKAVVNPAEPKEKISDALAVHGFHPSANKEDFVPKAADKAVDDKNLFVKR